MSGRQRTGWLVCLDTTGQKLWERRYVIEETSVGGNNFRHIRTTATGDIIAQGELSVPEGGSNVYIIKLDSTGCLEESCELYNHISILTSSTEPESKETAFRTYYDGDQLILTSPDTRIGLYQFYTLYTLHGQIVNHEGLDFPSTIIDTGNSPPGLYMLTITNFHRDILKTIPVYIK